MNEIDEQMIYIIGCLSECEIFPCFGGDKAEGQSDFGVLKEEHWDVGETEVATESIWDCQVGKKLVLQELDRDPWRFGGNQEETEDSQSSNISA